MSESEQGTQLDLAHTARSGSGLGPVYQALDLLLASRGHGDAALVVDVPTSGARRCAGGGGRSATTTRLLDREPGLSWAPPTTAASTRSTSRSCRTSWWRSPRSGSATTPRPSGHATAPGHRAVSLDELELVLRTLPGVRAVGFVEGDGLLMIEIQAGADAEETLARDATLRAHQHATGPVAVEVVRWGGGIEPVKDGRVQLVDGHDRSRGAGAHGAHRPRRGARARARQHGTRVARRGRGHRLRDPNLRASAAVPPRMGARRGDHPRAASSSSSRRSPSRRRAVTCEAQPRARPPSTVRCARRSPRSTARSAPSSDAGRRHGDRVPQRDRLHDLRRSHRQRAGRPRAPRRVDGPRRRRRRG